MSSLFDEIFCDMFGCKQEDLEIANETAKEFFGINFLVDLKKDEENDREKRKTCD